MAHAVISLGSNLGDRLSNLNSAILLMQQRVGAVILKSDVYESEPWGFKAKLPFFNQVLQIQTALNPHELLNALLDIENDLGRTRNSMNYESRTMDLDVLFYEDQIVNDHVLELPHPSLQDRKFVLQPLSQILPDFIHPVLKKSIQQLLDECNDKLWVKKPVS